MLIQEQGRKNNMADLIFKYGAMSCGKTTNLLQEDHNYNTKGMKTLILKPGCDTKGGKTIVSRMGFSKEVDFLIGSKESIIRKIQNSLKNVKVILVDEAQFLTRRQINELFVISKELDITIKCFGLKVDFKGNLFPGSEKLFALADIITEMEVVCQCGKPARFNARKVNGKFVSTGKQVAIDGVDDITYESLCGECFNKEVLQKSQSDSSKKTLIKVYKNIK